ncbi:hypothetical protein RRF57_007812 [Xylaria bambusicola]|uniref:Uncharacterized protein n=1 Tax=Xylaria bambusicola TaxID=326684 RepID=A0AAN7ULQ4_9PEZI
MAQLTPRYGINLTPINSDLAHGEIAGTETPIMAMSHAFPNIRERGDGREVDVLMCVDEARRYHGAPAIHHAGVVPASARAQSAYITNVRDPARLDEEYGIALENTVWCQDPITHQEEIPR